MKGSGFVMLHLGKYAVEGQMPDGSYAPDGDAPPFRIHNAEAQDWLWETFATRAGAEAFMLSLKH